MLQQKYNWILNGCRSLQNCAVFVVMSEDWIPDPFTVPLILIPWLVIPDPGAVIPNPTPFFCCWSLIPYTLLRPLRLFLAEMRLNVLVMCNRTEEERRRQTLCDKFCLKKLSAKRQFPSNRSFFKRPENINVKFTTNSQLIALSRLSHTSVLPLLEGKCRFHWAFNLFYGTWTTKL